MSKEPGAAAGLRPERTGIIGTGEHVKATIIGRKTKAATTARLAGPGARHASGFTFLELMVVVGLVGVIAAMATPYYVGYLRNYRIRNDGNGIVGLMTTARMRAGSDFARTAVSCSNPTVPPAVCKVYSLQYNATGGVPCTLSTWHQEPQQYTLSPTVTFAIPSGVTSGVQGQSATAPAQVYSGQSAPYTIYFNSRGWPIDCNGNLITNYALYMQDLPGTFSMAVGVDPSGRAQVWLLSGNSYWAMKD